MVDKLAKYKSIRTRGKTTEPFGDESPPFEKSPFRRLQGKQGKQGKPHPNELVFVVQKHSATALHYDFRLEVDGVMPSWAIPKGPTLDSGLRRLAMKTEDHPLDYQHFEGEIPQGEYGGGQVIIWDYGTYVVEKEGIKGARVKVKVKSDGEKLMLNGIEKGEIKFFLNGKRLKGSFALVKTKGFPFNKQSFASNKSQGKPPGSSRDTWLLIKHKDDFARVGYDVGDYVKSVVSDKELVR